MHLLWLSLDQQKYINRIIAWQPVPDVPHLPLSVCCHTQTTNFELASYKLKMASRATRQVCSVLSGRDCKDLQIICLRHLLANWDILGPIGGDRYGWSTYAKTNTNMNSKCSDILWLWGLFESVCQWVDWPEVSTRGQSNRRCPALMRQQTPNRSSQEDCEQPMILWAALMQL